MAFTDADANILVDIGDKNVAHNAPVLTADDPVINDQVARAFPRFTEQQRADTVRCLAENVEQWPAFLVLCSAAGGRLRHHVPSVRSNVRSATGPGS